jgi:hypothetical protein
MDLDPNLIDSMEDIREYISYIYKLEDISLDSNRIYHRIISRISEDDTR